MKDFGIKPTIAVAVMFAVFPSFPLLAQQAGASANAQDDASAAGATDATGKTTYTPKAGGFGDQAASYAWEMTPVTGELVGKLDTKTAKVGDEVVLKSTDRVQTADGTVIPRGSRLVGHVTQVQAYNVERGAAQIAIAFDHAELKNGQSIAVHTLIRGIAPSGSSMTERQGDDDNMMGMPVPAGSMANGGRMGPNYSSIAPENGAGLATSQVDRVSDAAVSGRNRENTNPGSTVSTTVQPAGSPSANTGAHGLAAARAIPHATAIPGVMLAGNSTSSGVFLAYTKNVQFDSGTQIQLGIVADK